MKLDEAESLARSLMTHNGLASWHIVWKPWVLIAGKCVRQTHWLVFSQPIAEASSEEEWRQIVLHEIAHALTDGQHDEAWRAVAQRLGCRVGEEEKGMVVSVLRAPSGLVTEEEAVMLSWRKA